MPLLYGPRLDGRSVLTKVDLRSLAFFSVMLLLIGLAGWLYLRQASEVAAYAHEIRELEADKERLHREITSLRAEVAMQGALQRVYVVGAQLGYHLPDTSDTSRRLRLVYQPPKIATALPGAGHEAGPSSDSNAEEPQTPGPVGGGNLFQRLLAHLREWIQSPLGDSRPQ